MKKIGMVSLGCPKNSVDTELLLGDLVAHGFEITHHKEEADFVIVNTCGFIEPAKRESIDAILDMARLKTEGKCSKLIVTGCLAERYSEELLKEIPEIDYMLGVNQYPRLKSILNPSSPLSGDGAKRSYVHAPAEYFESYTNRVLTTPFYSAYMKISEGCSNKCAFCIIPKMRGGLRSRSPESILAEAENLVQRGVREINIVSQDTTMYGIDLRMKDGLTRLLKSLARVDGVEWLRLLYCYPTFISSQLIDFIAAEEKVCRYIDVPLQHTHDDILRKMKRQEQEAGVRKMLDELRKKIPGVALRTTFITGFPGETETHFKHMVEFVENIQFDHVGVFTYFDEEGTAAFDYPDKVPAHAAEERKDELLRIQRKISLQKNHSRIGEIHPVLVEGTDPDESYLLTGRLPSQAPDIDGQVIIENSEGEPGQIIPMRITGATDYDLVAKAVNSNYAINA